MLLYFSAKLLGSKSGPKGDNASGDKPIEVIIT